MCHAHCALRVPRDACLSVPPVAMQAAVVRGLHMTAEQKAACLGALDLYRERVGPALQERKSLAHQMSAALALAEGQRNAATAAAAVAETGQPTHQVPGRLAGWSPGGVASAGDSANGCSSGSRSIDMTLEFMSAAESLQRNVGAEGTVLGVIRVGGTSPRVHATPWRLYLSQRKNALAFRQRPART